MSYTRARSSIMQDLQRHMDYGERKLSYLVIEFVLQSSSLRAYFLHTIEESNKDGGSSSGNLDKSKKKFLEVGFWGGSEGKSWDDGFFDGMWGHNSPIQALHLLDPSHVR